MGQSAVATLAFDSDERTAKRADSSDRVMGALQTGVRSRCSTKRRRLSSGFGECFRRERRERGWKSVKAGFPARNARVESRLSDAQPAGHGDSGPGRFAMSSHDASISLSDPGARAGRSTGSRRKRLGSR